MANRKFYLVEDHIPLMDYSDGAVIALTPEACYHLEKSGVSYNRVDKYYNEKELKAEESVYFYEQLEWLGEIDRILKDKIAYCGEHDINLARAHYYQLKLFIDSVIIQGRIFQEVLFNIKPDEIVYVCTEKNNNREYDIYNLFNNSKRIFVKLCGLACKKNETSFSIMHGNVKEMCIGSIQPRVKTIKKLLKKMHFKSVYYFFKYNKLNKLARSHEGEGNLRLLILHAGWLGIDILIKKSIKSGIKVFFRDENKIVLISGIIQKDVLDLTEFDAVRKKNITDDCSNAFDSMMKGKNVIKWINDRCGLDLSAAVSPHFKYFIEDICFHNILELMALKKFYNDEGIDFVITRSSSEEDSISAFLAAAELKRRVCFQHGIMHEAKEAAVTELDLVDYYFAMDNLSERFFKDCLQLGYASNCHVLQSPHYLNAIKNKWRNISRPKGVIMYVPSKVFSGISVFNINYYSPSWYYEMQKKIIDYFAEIKDRNFIYKYAPGQGWQDSSLLLYIKDKNCSNIRIEKRPLVECLGEAERIIFDYPSTGFFEAAVSGIPVLSLWYEIFEMDEKVRAFFGKSLRIYSTIPEAIRGIEYFIYAPSSDFIINMPLSDDNALDFLKRIKK